MTDITPTSDPDDSALEGPDIEVPTDDADDSALEGPDVEVPTNDADGSVKLNGLGDDGTIPNHPDGVTAGYSGTDSHFNPEEDDAANQKP